MACYRTPDLPNFCVPIDLDATGSWNGSICIFEGNPKNGPGAACSVPEGPLEGQQDCAHGLACAAATTDATEGTCIRLCSNASDCGRGECYACADEPFGSDGYGLCLDEVGCEPGEGDCTAVGCSPAG